MKTQHSNNFKQFLSKTSERKKAADHLSENIRLASRIAKIAVNGKSRVNAYKLKYSLILLGLSKFGDYFRVQSYELHRRLGVVVLIALSNRSAVHVPLKDLPEIQSLIDISTVPFQTTLPLQKRQHFFNFQEINFSKPAFC